MSEQSSNIVSKVWGLCNPLRDDGVSYGDYLEQLTYLIFLKMSDEYSRPPYKRETGIPKGYTWSDMNTLKGAELENQYRAILERLGDEGGILGQIFKGAVNKISNVSILYRVVQMIDKENWVSMSSDVKGEIYEGLLQKNAEDVKSGAGQYFTPRPLTRSSKQGWLVFARNRKKRSLTPAVEAAAFSLLHRHSWRTQRTMHSTAPRKNS